VRQELELTTEKMAFEGRAIARQNRFVIFVDGALPGEKVRAIITLRKRRHAYARVTGILEPSPHRRAAPCPVFGDCGGCAFQQMDYAAQIRMKRDVLAESLHGVPGLPGCIGEIIGAESPFHFRNKMGFAFGVHGGQPVIGLHRRGDWRGIVDARDCLLQSPESNEILRRVLRFATEHRIPVFDDETGEGCLRHVVVREGKHTGERMVHLHAAVPHPAIEEMPAVLDALCTTFLASYHEKAPEEAPEDRTFVLAGSGLIHERLNGLLFEIGPATFFQTNTRQAERLFSLIADIARPLRPKVAVDLYAGTGPIAMHLSPVAERVLGIESNEASVARARRNIEINGLRNVEVCCIEAEKTPASVFPNPCDLVVVDPPRPGLHRRAVESVVAARPRSLVYVSCNPATLARDLKLFVEAGFSLVSVQPLDMFPHAFHIEAVATLHGAGNA